MKFNAEWSVIAIPIVCFALQTLQVQARAARQRSEVLIDSGEVVFDGVGYEIDDGWRPMTEEPVDLKQRPTASTPPTTVATRTWSSASIVPTEGNPEVSGDRATTAIPTTTTTNGKSSMSTTTAPRSTTLSHSTTTTTESNSRTPSASTVPTTAATGVPNPNTTTTTTPTSTTTTPLPPEIPHDLHPEDEPSNTEVQAPRAGCGVSAFADDEPDFRIVGGRDAERGEWPWQVSIRLRHPTAGKLGHWCGGAIVNRRWIVTAAHCIVNQMFALPQATFWTVRLGDYSIKTTEGMESTVKVSNIYPFPWYKGYDQDIALIRLDSPANWTNYIRPVCLPDDDDEFQGLTCVATGWGKVDNNAKASSVLQEVFVRVFESGVCDSVYRPRFKIGIKKHHMCAGTLDGGRGTCHGDSGGPLMCRLQDGRWYLAGVTSFGSGCAKRGFPDVFSNVPHYMEWIREVMDRHEKEDEHKEPTWTGIF